ncbi:MAG: restriction endonuclease subunit S [Candidatus Thiodiazotropha taylori]
MKTTLGDLVDIRGGGTPSRKTKEYWGGNIPWVTVKDFKSTRILGAQESITQSGVDNSATNLIPAGNIIVPTRMALGKAAINDVDVAINQDLKALLIKNAEEIHSQYLLRYLETKAEWIERQGKGATVKGITVDVLKNLEVPLPPLPIQKQIAALLEKADTLRSQCKQMEQELNQLAQSVFLEMFGDPLFNPQGFKKRKLIELVEDKDDIKCGPFGTQLGKDEFKEEGIPLWGIKHVNSGFNIPTVEFVTSKKADYLVAYSLSPGDIVMTRKGTVGNCHIYPSDLAPGIMHSDLLKIRANEEKVLPEFLVRQFRLSRDVKKQMHLISQGAIMAGINVSKLKQLEVIVPPLKLQQKYVSAITAIEENKKINGVLGRQGEIEEIFQSLMQRAFSGKLDLTKAA